MKKIRVKTRYKNYNVILDEASLTLTEHIVKKAGLPKNLFLVIDENVFDLHEKYIKESLSGFSNKFTAYILRAGEQSKSIEGLTGIISALSKDSFGRDTLLIAIGGGVTGDLAGFAASIYMRGIQLVHVPTTILAAVDSAIGGKTGINFNKYKNTIGTFFQPEFVIVDTNFFQTLPADEINSGIGEVVKYAFLTSKNFYEFVINNLNEIYSLNKKVLNNVIYESVLFKGSVVSEDEFEKDLRKVLNLGHTFAHAYEGYSNYSIKHGEAVSIGIISALFLSYKKKLLIEKKLNKFLRLPLLTNISTDFKIKDYDPILSLMCGDKKNRDGEIRFILLQDIGNIIVDSKADKSDIIYAMEMTEKVLSEKRTV